MLLALVPAGGHIVTTTDCYRRTRQVRDRAGWVEPRLSQIHCTTQGALAATPCHPPSLPQFIQTFLPKMGIGATDLDPSDLAALEDALEVYPEGNYVLR